MKRSRWWFYLFLTLFCALLIAPAGLVWGQNAGIQVRDSSAAFTFAKEVRFRLTAQSDADIQSVILFYRVGDSRVVTRAYPEFQPGRQVQAEWRWQLYPGSLYPGALITYYWQISDAAGRQTRTTSYSLIYQDDRFDWQEYSRDLVHVYAYRDAKKAQELLQQALQVLEKLGQEIGVTLEQPIHIYVYANRNDMRLALPSRSERYDEMTVTLGMVVADDTLLLLGSEPDLEQTLAHELSHIVVGLATKNPFGDLPRWLDEGLAMYAEGELPARNRRALDQAVKQDDLISVRSLSGYSGDPAKVDLFYAESYSLVKFLLETYGREKLVALLQEFQQGAYQEDALQKVYGFGLDELDRQWRESLGLGPRQLPVTATPPSAEGAAGTPPASPTPAPGPAPGVCGLSILPGIGLLGMYLAARRRSRTPS